MGLVTITLVLGHIYGIIGNEKSDQEVPASAANMSPTDDLVSEGVWLDRPMEKGGDRHR